MFTTEPVYDALAEKNLKTRMKKQLGIPRLLQLEAAGLMSAKWLQNDFPSGKIIIVAGRGEKAAVGFAAARYLLSAGRTVILLRVFEKETYTADTKKMWLTINGLGLTFKRNIPRECSVVVDAILGNELKGVLPKKITRLINKINASGIPVVALDIPTGLHSHSNQISHKIAVNASRTLCFGFKKICHVLYPAAKHVGIPETLEIGLVAAMKANSEGRKDRKNLIETSEISPKIESVISCRLPRRVQTGHKNTFGHTLIIGGSTGYLGAPFLAGMAALRVGTGLVTVLVPKKALKLAKPCFPPEIMVTTPPSFSSKFETKDSDFILKLIKEKKINSVAIGMGVGKDSIDFLNKILSGISLPIILDGEALEVFPKKIAIKSDLVFATPHPGEFQKYFWQSNIQPEISDLIQTAKRLEIGLAYKSVTPIVTDGEKTFVFEHSFSALSKAGSGDVLSGIVAGLASQGFGKLSLPAAVWIHHAAGKKLHFKGLDYAATAGDIAQACQEIVQEIAQEISH